MEEGYKCMCGLKELRQPIVEGDLLVTYCWCGGFVSSKPKKPSGFNIDNHNWSDNDVGLSSCGDNDIYFYVNDCGVNHHFSLNRNDIIAAARVLKLTGEDLK